MFNLNQLKKYYTNAPSWMKTIYGAIPFDIRNGHEYRKWKIFLNENISIEEYELIKLKETVAYAYENTNYYKELFDNLQVSPHDINDKNDLSKLPTINKSIVQQCYADFLVHNFPIKKSFYVTTGGTSGTPMKFLQSKNMWAKEVAFIMNYFSKYDFNTNMTKASFRGGDFDNLPKNIFWKVNPHASEIHFSPFHINDNTIEFYVKELNRKSIKYFQTYPSSIKLLIEYMQKNKLKLNYQVDTVYLLSENILKSDIKLIQSFFHCRISSLFGHSERLIFAPNYDSDLSSYKIDRRYGLFELLDKEENQIKENNLVGEMIGTSFDNYSMPLIRYKTGDMSNYLNKDDYIISSIEGRWKQEYLLGINSMKIYLTALNMHSDIFKNVIKFQFVQYDIGMAELCLQVKNTFNEIDKKIILNELNKKAGHVIEFDIKIVDQFMLTHRGKFINIVKKF
jgi:phenylacetate-CoA ligase